MTSCFVVVVLYNVYSIHTACYVCEMLAANYILHQPTASLYTTQYTYCIWKSRCSPVYWFTPTPCFGVLYNVYSIQTACYICEMPNLLFRRTLPSIQYTHCIQKAQGSPVHWSTLTSCHFIMYTVYTLHVMYVKCLVQIIFHTNLLLLCTIHTIYEKLSIAQCTNPHWPPALSYYIMNTVYTLHVIYVKCPM